MVLFLVDANKSKHFPQAQTAALGKNLIAKKAHPLQPREKQVIPGPVSMKPTANPQERKAQDKPDNLTPRGRRQQENLPEHLMT